MVDIRVEKRLTGLVVLKVTGEIDGSSAWRVVRLALRLRRGRSVAVDLGGVERMLTFGAAVLAQGLGEAGATCIAVRPEHRRLLVAEGLLSEPAGEPLDELPVAS
jgi:anti-anti-sigma regulatory factor